MSLSITEPESVTAPDATPADGTASGDIDLTAAGSAAGDAAAAAPGGWRLMIAVTDLVAHPGNVRENLDLSAEFCASVAVNGVRVPLLVTTGADGAFRVIEGHRRLAAAVKTGVAEVPVDLDAGRADDEAGQYLDMVTANSDAYRRNFTALEEASALFAAHEAGATRTRIRRATGRKLPQVKAALDAGRLSAGAREQVAGLDRQLTLDELALMAEFEPDRDALSQLLDAARYGYALEHIAERIRLDRAEAAEHEKISAALEASGCPVTADLPGGASLLTGLLHDGADITAESHRDCPGHGAYFRSYDLKEPVYYCAVPAANGHVSRWAAQAAATYDTGTGGGLGWAGADAGDTAVEAGGGLEDGPGSLVSSVREVPDPEAEAARRLIVEGDKAWAAAAEVRRRWVAQLLARRAAPPQAARFTAAQLLLMPQVLRQALTAAPGRALFTELTGRSADAAAAECGICPAGRIALLMLAPVAVAFESQMAGPDERRGTWRVSRWAPCPRHEAGTWLRFLADLGYQMSAIEQAVADDQPWTGDAPAEPDREEPGADDPDAAPAEPPTGDTDGIAAGEAGSAGEPEGYPGEAA